MKKVNIKWAAIQDGSHLLDETNKIRIDIHTLPKLAACTIFNTIYEHGDAESFRIALQHDPKYYTIATNIHTWHKRLLTFKLYLIKILGKKYKSGYYVITNRTLYNLTKDEAIQYLREGYSYTKVHKSIVLHKRRHI